MDKYQKKILKFISSQKYNPLKIENKYNISDHLLIKKIIEKCQVIKSINTTPSYSINKINKLHNLDEDSLLYLLFRELDQYQIKSFNDFSGISLLSSVNCNNRFRRFIFFRKTFRN